MGRFTRNQIISETDERRISSTVENHRLSENNLHAKLAEAFGRYDANTAIAANYRDKVIPSLARAYREMVRRHQLDAEEVALKKIVDAHHILGKELKNYLTALRTQWQAGVDIASIAEVDGPISNK